MDRNPALTDDPGGRSDTSANQQRKTPPPSPLQSDLEAAFAAQNTNDLRVSLRNAYALNGTTYIAVEGVNGSQMTKGFSVEGEGPFFIPEGDRKIRLESLPDLVGHVRRVLWERLSTRERGASRSALEKRLNGSGSPQHDLPLEGAKELEA